MQLVNYQKPFTCIINFCNSILGSSVLTNPYIIMLLGWGLSLPVIAFFVCLNLIGFYALKKGSDEFHVFGFRPVIQELYPKWMGVLVSVCQIVVMFGSLIGYVIVIKDNFFFFEEESKLYANLTLFGIMLVLVMPLCYLPSLDHLRFNSYVDVIVIIYLDVVLVVGYFLQDEHPAVEPVDVKVDSLYSISLLTHSYCAITQYNYLFLYRELGDRYVHIKKVTGVTVATYICIYLVCGFFGYLTFGAATQSNILKNLCEEKTGLSMSVNVAMILLMVVHIPVVVYSTRKTFEQMIFKEYPSKTSSNIIASCIIVMSTLTGCLLKSLDNILDFTSSLCGGTIGLICPGLIMVKMSKTPSQRILSILYTAVGGVITFGGFGVACYKWIVQPMLSKA